jgi:hypothetical protein
VCLQCPTGDTLPKDAVRRDANHVYNEWLPARRQRRQDWSTAQAVARVWGEDTPFEPEYSRGYDEEENQDGEEGK